MSIRTSMAALALVFCMSGCATLGDSLVTSPSVKLSNVEVVGLGFNSQTFILTFDVSNPNPFTLPIDSVAYGIKLDGHRFASGETTSDISVPASGNEEFAISVELDLIKTAPQLLTLVRNGLRNDIPYELEGAFGLDVPMAPVVRYHNAGHIRIGPDSY